MKILVESDNQKNPRTICRNCNAVLEISARDVKEVHTYFGPMKVVTCPCCGEDITLHYFGTLGKAMDKFKDKIFNKR